MKKNPWLMLLVLAFVFGTIFVFMIGASVVSLFGTDGRSEIRLTSKDSILHLKIDGVIMDGRRFIKNLRRYREDKNVKAIVVEINSPGGVVGPSQELYMELKKVRDEINKPVVAVSTGMMASGAYYAAMGASEIVVAPGTLMGSIGVIMSFANLERLYDWAKISRYTITTGKYKDSGADYRSMRQDERELFQKLADEVLGQFKEAVSTNRKIDNLDEIADGRIFTGSQALELSLADRIGTREEAFQRAAELAGLQEGKYEVFEPRRERASIRAWLMDEPEDAGVQGFLKVLADSLKTDLNGQLLYIMPGVL